MRDLAALPAKATKTNALLHALQHNPGNVLFCHTATYPLLPLEPLFADIEKGALYLHAPHPYSETDLDKILRRFTAIRDKTATTVTTPPLGVKVWHAAVIGLSDRHKALVDRLLRDEIPGEDAQAANYSYTKVFSETSKIKSADTYIFEYTNFEEFNQLLRIFFQKNEEESIPNQVKLIHHIDAATIQQQKEQFQQQPLLKKWLQTLSGRKWSIKQYESKW
jgi:hypothetical protein